MLVTFSEDNRVAVDGQVKATLVPSPRYTDSYTVHDLDGRLLDVVTRPPYRQRWAVGHGRTAHRFLTLERAIEYILRKRQLLI